MKWHLLFFLLFPFSGNAQQNIAAKGTYLIPTDCSIEDKPYCFFLASELKVVTYEKNKQSGQMQLRFAQFFEDLTLYASTPKKGTEDRVLYWDKAAPKVLHFRIDQVKKKSVTITVISVNDFANSPLALLDTVADTLALAGNLKYTFANRYSFETLLDGKNYPSKLKIVDTQTDKEILTTFAPNHSLQLKMVPDGSSKEKEFYINFLDGKKWLLSFNISTQPIATNPGRFLGFTNVPKLERFFEVSTVVRDMAAEYANKPASELYYDDPFDTYGLTPENVAEMKTRLAEHFHMSFDNPAGKRMDTIGASIQFIIMYLK